MTIEEDLKKDDTERVLQVRKTEKDLQRPQECWLHALKQITRDVQGMSLSQPRNRLRKEIAGIIRCHLFSESFLIDLLT